MIDMIKMTVVLTLIACAAALLIAFTNEKTESRIAAQNAAAEMDALNVVVPVGAQTSPARFWYEEVKDSVSFWNVTVDNASYYAFKVGARGYSSIIKSVVCIDTEGTIIGMTVLEQGETPGLGTRVQEVLSKKYFWNGLVGPKEKAAPWFTRQFTGITLEKPIAIEKSLGEWHGLSVEKKGELLNKNGITAITGSTISTRAVIKSLSEEAANYLKAIRG